MTLKTNCLSENDHLTANGIAFTAGIGRMKARGYYCGQESLRRNGVAIMVNKTVQHAVLGCNLKTDRMISVHFQGNHSISW